MRTTATNLGAVERVAVDDGKAVAQDVRDVRLVWAVRPWERARHRRQTQEDKVM